jgi:hypothetical protein
MGAAVAFPKVAVTHPVSPYNQKYSLMSSIFICNLETYGARRTCAISRCSVSKSSHDVGAFPRRHRGAGPSPWLG